MEKIKMITCIIIYQNEFLLNKWVNLTKKVFEI